MPIEPKVLKAGEGREGRLGALGIRCLVSGNESAGGFTLIEHRNRSTS